MVGFRKAAGAAPVAGFWSNGNNQVAFARGDRAFLVLNHELTALSQTLPTGLAEGQYCDVLSGEKAGAQCSGAVITVDAAGSATFEVAPETGVAIHVGQKL
jgi:alpha-amylase